MDFLRITLATLGFIAGTLLIMSLLFFQFDWKDMLAAFIFYLFAYSIWPSKKRGKRNSENAIFDVLEFVIEFPIEFVIWFFRTLGRLFKRLSGSKDSGVDFDIDL